jgi:outer membrane protein
MKYTLILLIAFSSMFSSKLYSKDRATIGVVNFTTCVTNSKFGKQEQGNFDKLREQMTSMIEESQKELQEMSAKLDDADYVDGLSPKAEEELKMKFQTKNQDMQRLQNQYYQVLQQANMQVMQKMNQNVSTAAEAVAKQKNLNLVMNKEACFYHKPTLEVTDLVIAEMNKTYEVEEKKKKLAEKTEEKASENQVSKNTSTPKKSA